MTNLVITYTNLVKICNSAGNLQVFSSEPIVFSFNNDIP
jgi:hypothetical protein